MQPFIKTYAAATLVIGAVLVSSLPSVNDNKVTRFVMDLFRARNAAEASPEAEASTQAKPQCIRNLEYLMKQRMSSTGNTTTIDNLIKNALLFAYNTASASGDDVIEEYLAELLKVSVEEVRASIVENLPVAVMLQEYDPELE
jgi:hypothetical protein